MRPYQKLACESAELRLGGACRNRLGWFGDEIVFHLITSIGWNSDRILDCLSATVVSDDIVGDRVACGRTSGKHGVRIHPAEYVAVDHVIFRALQQDPFAAVDLPFVFVLLFSLHQPFPVVAVREIIARYREASAVLGYPHAEFVNDREGVRADRTPPGIPHVDTAAKIVSYHIGAQCDPVAIAVENDRRSCTFFDHVSGDN